MVMPSIEQPAPTPKDCKACQKRYKWWALTMVIIAIAVENGIRIMVGF